MILKKVYNLKKILMIMSRKEKMKIIKWLSYQIRIITTRLEIQSLKVRLF